MKILVIGKGGHGKGEFCKFLKSMYGFRSISSSRYCCKEFIFEDLKDNYKNEEECYNDRRNHRDLWYKLICNYNTPDKSRVARGILEHYEIYDGMRDLDEFEASKDLFDLVVYIDADKRVGGQDTTMKIPKEAADIIINNNKDIFNLMYISITIFSFLKDKIVI